MSGDGHRPRPPLQPGIALRNLAVARGSEALVCELEMLLPRGTLTSVLGPSGVGKSSLLATLAGVLPPASGEVVFRSEDQSEFPPIKCKKSMGLVFQHLNLSLNVSALTNALCGALGRRSWLQTLFGFPKEDAALAEQILDALGLKDLSSMPVSSISGGERQRVAVARALVQNPEWLFADEPVAHLDSERGFQTLALLKEQCLARSMTAVCVLHDRSLAETFSDRILLLEGRGRWRVEGE